MQVTCYRRRLMDVYEPDIKQRLCRSIHLDENIDLCNIEIGATYVVQCIEYSADGLWVYIHDSFEKESPEPYPLDLFKIVDSRISPKWSVDFTLTSAGYTIKRISFPEWANDDGFYERLYDGDISAVQTYQMHKAED